MVVDIDQCLVFVSARDRVNQSGLRQFAAIQANDRLKFIEFFLAYVIYQIQPGFFQKNGHGVRAKASDLFFVFNAVIKKSRGSAQRVRVRISVADD
jgi:hypothetical protein